MNFLERYMDNNGHERLDDLIGVSAKYLGRLSETMDLGGRREVASVNRDRCTNCGICLKGFGVGCMAEDKKVKGKPVVLEEICGACGFCALLCPLEAISLVRREHALSPTVRYDRRIA